MIDDNTLADLVEAAFPGVAVVYRFGSTASGEDRAGSDIDIGFLPPGPIDPVRRFDAQERLAAHVRRDVDLVDLHAASTVLRMQIVSRGRAIRVRNAAEQGRFEDFVFSSYARLNEERREILEQVSREGSVHGGYVIVNKAATIERCIARVREEHAGDDRNLTGDQTRQDSIVLNLQRACEAAIDLAMHVVRVRRLGVPQETRDAFALLRDAGLITPELANRMMAMVGFRNVAVHDYRRLDLAIVRSIVTERLGDFLELTRVLLTAR